MALCEERVYDDAMPYFCHTHRKHRAKSYAFYQWRLGATQAWPGPCHSVDTLALEKDWMMYVLTHA